LFEISGITAGVKIGYRQLLDVKGFFSGRKEKEFPMSW
jgi:hypothetical protein